MFDPSIQTFCCYKAGVPSPSLAVMLELNSRSYNTVCLVSSIIGCIGAIYQLLPRRDALLSRRWYSMTSLRGRQIIVWLAFADFNASLGVLIRSIVKLNSPMMISWGESTQVAFCAILAVWIEYFYVVTWAWTLFYAVDTWLALQKKAGMPKFYHSIAWTVPAALTSFGLAFLYYPDADCHNYSTKATRSGDVFFRLLPNYVTIYLIITLVMVTSPCFYFMSARKVDLFVADCLHQVTRKERSVIQSMRLRFALINLSFYACWFPNLINGIIIWSKWSDMPRTLLLALWYIMAVTNPLQAFFNSLVYRQSNMKVCLPLAKESNEETPLIRSNINT
ncbi:G-protein coupled receptor 143-like isoform X2 [Cimex lectularius]|uniref:G-protein coupled receptors family 1 profile domain-containing protein n=1 Tax=Cimex lectularius TaxID=79782 RepID=A0A8I6TCL0_CIMLE|nr:G-protein coupled receptor 143-like isoform X2 [Cimex lectularius]